MRVLRGRLNLFFVVNGNLVGVYVTSKHLCLLVAHMPAKFPETERTNQPTTEHPCLEGLNPPSCQSLLHSIFVDIVHPYQSLDI